MSIVEYFGLIPTAVAVLLAALIVATAVGRFIDLFQRSAAKK